MDERILKKVYEKVENGEKVAFATITGNKGSTPAKVGCTIAIFEDESFFGTVGGGHIEYKIIEKCRECIKSEIETEFNYSLNEDLSMKCGGTANGFIKIFKPRPKLIIIGGGHIGFSLYNIAKNLDFHTTIIDEREEFANDDRFKEADQIYCDKIEYVSDKININQNTYIVIATKGFDDDLRSVRSVINKDAKYIGVIGSNKKWIELKNTLIDEKISIEKLNKIYAPIGLNISTNDVGEIALAIIAEILIVKNNGKLEHRKSNI